MALPRIKLRTFQIVQQMMPYTSPSSRIGRTSGNPKSFTFSARPYEDSSGPEFEPNSRQVGVRMVMSTAQVSNSEGSCQDIVIQDHLHIMILCIQGALHAGCGTPQFARDQELNLKRCLGARKSAYLNSYSSRD